MLHFTQEQVQDWN